MFKDNSYFSISGNSAAANAKSDEALEIAKKLKDDKLSEEKITAIRRVLLLDELGLIKPLLSLDISADNRYELISQIVGRNKDTIKTTYLKLEKAKKNPELFKSDNYKFLQELFEKVGLHSQALKMLEKRIKAEKHEIVKLEKELEEKTKKENRK